MASTTVADRSIGCGQRSNVPSAGLRFAISLNTPRRSFARMATRGTSSRQGVTHQTPSASNSRFGIFTTGQVDFQMERSPAIPPGASVESGWRLNLEDYARILQQCGGAILYEADGVLD